MEVYLKFILTLDIGLLINVHLSNEGGWRKQFCLELLTFRDGTLKRILPEILSEPGELCASGFWHLQHTLSNESEYLKPPPTSHIQLWSTK